MSCLGSRARLDLLRLKCGKKGRGVKGRPAINFKSPPTTSSPSWRRPPTTSTTPTVARSMTCSVWATSWISGISGTRFGAGARRAGGRTVTPRRRLSCRAKSRPVAQCCATYKKEGSLHTFGSARPLRSGVLCSALVPELTCSELTGPTPGSPLKPPAHHARAFKEHREGTPAAGRRAGGRTAPPCDRATSPQLRGQVPSRSGVLCLCFRACGHFCEDRPCCARGIMKRRIADGSTSKPASRKQKSRSHGLCVQFISHPQTPHCFGHATLSAAFGQSEARS